MKSLCCPSFSPDPRLPCLLRAHATANQGCHWGMPAQAAGCARAVHALLMAALLVAGILYVGACVLWLRGEACVMFIPGLCSRPAHDHGQAHIL